MRGNGRVYRPTWTDHGVKHTTQTWWLDYTVRGERHREPSGTKVQKKALELLHARVGDRRDGRLVGNPDDLTVHDLRELVERQYDLDGRRSKRRISQCWVHVEGFFGAHTRVPALTTVRVDEYRAARLAGGAAPQTVNNEVAALRRGFKLAAEKGLVSTMPVIKLPKVLNARTGFFEDGDFAAVLLGLPAYLRPLIRFLRLTGWRREEGVGLTWTQVDWDDQAPEGAGRPQAGPSACVRLAAAATKGGDARTFPFGQAPELQALLEAQWDAGRGPFVFHRGGRRIGSFRRVWATACLRAGLATKDAVTKKITVHRLVHDLRRTAARAFRRAGVSEGETMRVCGWKTRAMFDRYNVIDEQDLAQAVARRFAHGKGTAKTGGPVGSLDALSSSGTTTPL